MDTAMVHSNSSPIVLWFTYLALAVTALAQPEGNVTIMVVDSTGAALPYMAGEVLGLRGAADISSHFNGLRGTHIPYGTYVVNLLRTPLNPLSKPIETRIDVKQPDTLYIVIAPRIQLPSSSIGDRQLPANYEIRGHVQPFMGTGSEPMWIRLVPTLRTDPIVDVEINSSGDFRIYRVLIGRYVAIVLRGGKIIDTQEITFDLSPTGLQKVVLKLSDHSPSLGLTPEDVPK
jgi:hypothetical protein